MQPIYIFRILLCILKSETIVIVCVKHALVLFQPLIMEVWIWSQASVCAIYGGQSGTGSSSSSESFSFFLSVWFSKCLILSHFSPLLCYWSTTLYLAYQVEGHNCYWLWSGVPMHTNSLVNWTSQSRQILVTIHAICVIVIGILSKDQSIKTDLGYCLGCHCAVLHGT